MVNYLDIKEIYKNKEITKRFYLLNLGLNIQILLEMRNQQFILVEMVIGYLE